MVSERFENNFVTFHICFEIVILVIAQEAQSPGFVSCSTVVAIAAILKFEYYITYLNSVIENEQIISVENGH